MWADIKLFILNFDIELLELSVLSVIIYKVIMLLVIE